MTDGCYISSEIALRWTSQDLNDDMSTLVQVMAWWRQATSHYLSQCCPRSLSPYSITRSQWVKLKSCRVSFVHNLFRSWMMIDDDNLMIVIKIDWWWLIMKIMINEHNSLHFGNWSWLLIDWLLIIWWSWMMIMRFDWWCYWLIMKIHPYPF